MRFWAGLALTSLVVLCLAGCGQGFEDRGLCVHVPRTFPQNRLVTSGSTVRAPVGSVLWVALVESAKLFGHAVSDELPLAEPHLL